MKRDDFIRANTAILRPPHVPEIRLHLADEAPGLWQKTETELDAIGLPPPFWAFAWAGGQGLARHVLDHPEVVAGRTVLDFASGSGLVAIAAAMAGAASVTAVDTDPFCKDAVRLNAALNGVSIDFDGNDRIGSPVVVDVILAGDVFFDRELAERLTPCNVSHPASINMPTRMPLNCLSMRVPNSATENCDPGLRRDCGLRRRHGAERSVGV